MTEYFAPCVACSVLQEVAVVVKEHGTGLYLSEWKDAVLHAHLHSKLSSYCYTHHHCVSDQTLTSQCAFLYTVQPPQVVFPGLGTKGAVLAHRRGRGRGGGALSATWRQKGAVWHVSGHWGIDYRQMITSGQDCVWGNTDHCLRLYVRVYKSRMTEKNAVSLFKLEVAQLHF